MNCTRTSSHQSNSLRAVAFCFSALGLATLLAGCGTVLPGTSSGVVTPAAFQISGMVHGGQQPVVGSTIQLYTVGTSGLKSASTALVGSTVLTDGTGAFSITGKYNCTALPATQVYITATGGNPGAGTNSALSLGAALGACSSLSSNTFIQMNEVTTIAAAYALAPFASDLTHIGATGSNPAGLVGAFANAALLANYATGTPGSASLAAGTSVPSTEINTLADIIGACVNSTGPASSPCSTLFSATSATDTFGASFAMARNPGASAVTGLFSLVTASAPFQPTLSSAPNDFTVALTTTANAGLATPSGIAIDAAGNAWVTNEAGSAVTQISASGTNLLSPTAPNLFGAQGIALDRSGNVWVANTAGNSVVKFTLSGGTVATTNSYATGGISGPSAIALDSAGTAWTSNFNGNSVTALTSAGVAIGGSPFTGNGNNIKVPTSIAINGSGSVYVTSGTGSVVNLANTGAFVATLNDGTLQGPSGVAIDSSNRIAASGFTTGTAVGGALSQFTSAGIAVSGSPSTFGITAPAGLSSDGTSVWVANNTASGGLAQFAVGTTTQLSPSAGYGSLTSPVGVAVDATGSVWTTNSGSNTVSKFIGLGAPVTTPLAVTAGP